MAAGAAVSEAIINTKFMELIPTIISLCGFGIVITYVLLVHKAISSADKDEGQPVAPKVKQSPVESQTMFIRKTRAATTH